MIPSSSKTAFYFIILFFNCSLSFSQFEIILENKSSSEEYDLVLKELEKSSLFLKKLFNYHPKETFEIRAAETLKHFQTRGLPLWLGGYYSRQSAYIQPVLVLKNKNALEKTLFIEYAHFFIDSYTRERCPDWLNEMLSLYFYYHYAALSVPFESKNYKLSNFKDFINLKKNLKEHALSNAFFHNALLFSFWIEKKLGAAFWIEILTHIKKGTSVEKAFLKKTKHSLAKLYENDFQ